MAKALGRKVTLERNGEPIANLRTKSLEINNELVDVTDDDSSGWREHLDEPGQKEVNLSVEGVLANDKLREEAFSTSSIKADTLIYPDGGTVSGDFALASYSEEHNYNEPGTFSAEIQSSGAITYTAA